MAKTCRKYRVDVKGRSFRLVDSKRRLLLLSGWKEGAVMVEELDQNTLVVRKVAIVPGQEWIPAEAKILDDRGRLFLPEAWVGQAVAVQELEGELVVKRVNVVAASKRKTPGEKKK